MSGTFCETCNGGLVVFYSSHDGHMLTDEELATGTRWVRVDACPTCHGVPQPDTLLGEQAAP